MKYISTKIFAFLTIFFMIGIIVAGVVLTIFDIYWLVTGEMPSRIVFLKLTVIPTLIIQIITLLTLTTKKT